MVSYWSCLVVIVFVVDEKVYGYPDVILDFDLDPSIDRNEICSWTNLDYPQFGFCAMQIPTMTLENNHEPITGEQLIAMVKKDVISIVNFNTDVFSYGELFHNWYGFYKFKWVNDAIGTSVMTYPVNYEMLSMKTIKLKEITVNLDLNGTECSLSINNIIFAMEAILRNVSETDLFCFENPDNMLFSRAYNLFATSCMCLKFIDGLGCKAQIHYTWNVLIIVICYVVMLFCPLLIGVFLKNPHRKHSNISYNQSQQEVTRNTHEPMLTLHSPLPLGAKFGILHWGNTHAWILSIRVFMLCEFVILLNVIITNTHNFDFDADAVSYYALWCQSSILLIITIRPATLSVFNDGSDCGLDFDSNRYTCLYRQILNRFQFVINLKIWKDRPFADITSNSSMIFFRFIFFIMEILVSVFRLLRYMFPLLYFTVEPILSIFKYVFGIIFSRPTGTAQGRQCPIICIPLYFIWSVIRAFMLTTFVVSLSLDVMIIVYIVMQVIVLTTIGIITNYGEDEEAVLRAITILFFCWYIISSIKEYYNTYAAVWRTIVDAGEAWQSGRDNHDYNLIGSEIGVRRHYFLPLRNAHVLSKPLVVYKELVPTLPEALLFHVINKCKKTSVQKAKLILWNVILGIFFAIAYSTIVSTTADFNKFTEVSKSMLTLAMGAFPKLLSVLFTTQEYIARQEAEKRQIWHEVFNYAETNGYEKAGHVQNEEENNGEYINIPVQIN